MDVIKWVTNLGKLGYEPNSEDEASRRIAFSNVVFLTLPIVYIIFMVFDYESYLKPVTELSFDQWVVPIIIGVCFFCLWLNKSGFPTISRALFIILWPLLLHIIPIKLQETPPDYSLAYPFGLVFHSILIQLMFSFKWERALFVSFLSMNLIAMILSPALLVYFDTDLDLPRDLVNYRYYFLDGILYWLLFNLVSFYVLNKVDQSIQRLIDSRKLIEKQKDELNIMNQNLEQLVAERTSQLEAQNEKLRQHAFYNAHLLRAPFTNIQGLVKIQIEIETKESATKEADLKEVRSKLNESINELNMRINEIQKLVETKIE